MRYIDTGSRDPQHALGAWLADVAADPSVIELRWQTGFFGAHALGHFVPLMDRLRAGDAIVRVLVGSNDGTTRREDIEILLRVAGPPRARCEIGVVSFDNGYFHPKTVHLTRDNGSSAAYVGSANLTRSGVASLHIEAGILLDTNEGDDPEVVQQVASAIDWWFVDVRKGLTVVSLPEDLDRLVDAGILDVPRPPLARSVAGRRHLASAAGARVSPLVSVPPLPLGLVGSLALIVRPAA